MKKKAFFHMLYTAQNAVFPLILAGYLSRVLAPEGVGQVAYGRNLVSYFTMLSLLGLPQYAMREIARGREEKDRLFSELAVVSFGISAVSAACCGTFLAWRHSGDVMLRVLALEVVFQAFSVEWLYQGREDFGFMALRCCAEKLLTLISVFCFVRGRQDVLAYCLIYVAGKGFGTAWNLLHARRYVKWRSRGLDVKRHLAPVAVLMLGSAAAGLYSRVDITMLGLLGSEACVGYYANAHKVVNIVLALVTAVSAVFLPRLSREFGKAEYEKTAARGLEAVLTLAVPGCVGLWLTAEDVTLVLFGAAFLPGVRALRILSALVLVKGLGDMVCYQVLFSAGRERILTAGYLLALLLNAGLNGLLIPQFGHDGAAAASLAGEVAVVGLLLPAARKAARPSVDRRFLWGVLLGTAVMAAVVLLLQGWMQSGIFRLAACVSAGAAAYFAAGAVVWKAGMGNGNGNSDRFGKAL